MVDSDLKTQATEAAEVDDHIRESWGHKVNVGIAVRNPDCPGETGKASLMRLVLGITGKIVVVLVTEMSLSLFVMGLIGKFGAVRLSQWSLMVTL